MSGMDRLTEMLDGLKAEQAPFIEGGPRHPSKKNAYFRALAEAYERGDLVVAHRRASQAAPAPSDGLREAVEAAAWNDAIEAAAVAAEEWDTFGPTVRAIRALRRAAPTEDR